MDDSSSGINWGGIGSFVTDAAKAAASVKDAFDGQERADLRAAETKSKSEFAWQPIALALGGVLVVAIALKFAFRK